jgi:hypothetical protein
MGGKSRMFTRNTLKDFSAKYKEIMVDVPAREALHQTDKRFIKRVRLYSLQGVDAGRTDEYDERGDPRCADFPVGDSRRW